MSEKYSELKEQGSKGPFEVRCRINVHSANGTFTFNTYNEADAKLVTHVLNNFDQLLEVVERCKEVFVNDDWDGPLKVQIEKALKDAQEVSL